MAELIDWLTPSERMPWTVSTPFRMRPNLEKLDPISPALLLHDDLASAYAGERERVLREARERARVGEANESVLSAINGLSPSLQEDFVILKHEGDSLRTEYLSVCFPSRWDPREKLGLDFSQIHAPVADNQLLLAAGSSIMTMAFMKQPMLRHVWLIVPSASLPQHPDQNDYSWAETLRDPSPLLPRLYFRVERQTTWPLPQFDRAVFFIRVMMSELVDVLRVVDPARPELSSSRASRGIEGSRAGELASALRSMTPEVVAYRGMTEAMPRLLTELDAFS